MILGFLFLYFCIGGISSFEALLKGSHIMSHIKCNLYTCVKLNNRCNCSLFWSTLQIKYDWINPYSQIKAFTQDQPSELVSLTNVIFQAKIKTWAKQNSITSMPEDFQAWRSTK